MNLEAIHEIIDEYIKNSEDPKKNHIHAYTVSRYASLLAQRRKLDSTLAAIMGLLHDVYFLRSGTYKNHDILGAEMAEKILTDTGLFSADEIKVISQAIARHDSNDIHDPYDEILKDADYLANYPIRL
jgi:HD superfamily phosphodiesterase